MLLKIGVNLANHIHQNNIKNGQNFKWVPDHLIIQVRIIIKHMVRIYIKPISFNFKHPPNRPHILSFNLPTLQIHNIIPKILQKPHNRSINILNTNISPPHIHGWGVIGIEPIPDLRRRGWDVGGGGRWGGNGSGRAPPAGPGRRRGCVVVRV
uniref:Uncharacterized protein n=1 Tax=Opuntia streptacantha TaxID=393608 RepID=A0A7C9EQC6_OPUST